VAIQNAKKGLAPAVHDLSDGGFAVALAEAEKVFLEELMTAADPSEGIAAFYEKRRPVWKNR
jgi:enoyl-CoA hydratase/carnithine racemase